jgi:ribosome-associated protein
MLKESIIDGLKNGKAKSISCIDLRKISGAVADYFIVCHGESSTQVEGLKKAVYESCLKINGEKPWHEEGVTNAQWILMDYVNVVVHIFHKESREFYNLEELWADAPTEEFANV